MVERSGRIWSTGEGNGKPPQYFCLEKPMSSMIREKERTVKDELPRLKRSVFISIPKKGNSKECSNYCISALISHASNVMLKILQARLQQYVNQELPDVQLVLDKAEEQEIKLPTSTGSSKKQESSRNTSISVLLTTPKSLTVWITRNCGKF